MSNTYYALIAQLSKSLTDQNYNKVVVSNHRNYARAFLDYLNDRDIPVAKVTPSQVDEYFRYAVKCFHKRYGRSPSSRWHRLPRTSLDKLLQLAQGQWPPDPEINEPDAKLCHEICQEYETWLREERGLADATIAALTREARFFLRWRLDNGNALNLKTLTVQDIDKYIDMRSQGLRRGSLSCVCRWTRLVLNYLQQTGRVSSNLAPQIIGPKLYAYEGVPSVLETSQIAAVLAFTKQDRSARGLRDYAILQLLAAYGLRAGEIRKLRLEDINWRSESLAIRHTKTNARSHLPLLAPVGEALLDYLRHGRPDVEIREVFTRSCAPYKPLVNIYSNIRRRLEAAGVHPPGKCGPHIFRHARAVELLRASVPQKVIGDLLGHRSTDATIPYLKLATEDLRSVALDVPGSAVLS